MTLDAPRDPGEGEITAVKMDYVHETALDRVPATCGACDGAIARDEPHAEATVWIDTPPIMGTEQRMCQVHFCDRECWADWASAE